MAEIIIQRHRFTKTYYERRFFRHENDGGYAFACDENGNLSPNLHECAVQNYNDCVAGKHPELKDLGIVSYTLNHTQNAVAICECGEEIELWDHYLGSSECEHCGRWHNMCGQEVLAPGQYDPEGW